MEIKKLDIFSVCWQVIINPHALSGKGQKCLHDIFTIFVKHRIDFQTNIPDNTDELIQTMRKLCDAGFHHFIFLGGDGTANLILNGIFLPGTVSDDIYFVPIPTGTGNDWIRTHNYPADYHEIVHNFIKGQFAAHDIGLVKSYRNGIEADARLFINIAGFCFDAEVIRKATKGKTPMFASITYLYCLLKTLFNYKNQHVTIHADEMHIDDRIFTIAVGICKYNGNGMMQAPTADPFDGLLDVVVIRKLSPFKVIANIVNLFSGKHLRLREVSIFRTRELEIAATPCVLGEVEGEILTQGNYKISLLEQKVNVLRIER
ncbi:MAG: hypothetical protein LBD45_07730 [Bacteroidales bacterium]|jgi:YegS/Rv2252/BmrU family lipid kinase|nr:hypothetical protein [Bacteroidales bacterium]